MTDTDKLLALLQAAGTAGVHTSELRYRGVSGNPSQRRADLQARGYIITSTIEPYPSDPRRRGARYRLVSGPSTACVESVLSSSTQPVPAAQPHSSLGLAAGTSPSRARCAIFDVDDFDEAA